MMRIQLRVAALACAGILAITTTPAWAASQPAAGQPAPCRTSDLALDWTTGGTAKPDGSKHPANYVSPVFR
ncbi:hypothetical protein AB0I94_25020 [Streptomyces sp. NPDC050147]|uniref:hypothetical protein n=1 Tax=Streptomyces sp. NPDC050147 TaxID=3155513 RepID=UPI003436940D